MQIVDKAKSSWLSTYAEDFRITRFNNEWGRKEKQPDYKMNIIRLFDVNQICILLHLNEHGLRRINKKKRSLNK